MPSKNGQILAFKHCCFDSSRIFCFRVPKHCPLCDKQIVAGKRSDEKQKTIDDGDDVDVEIDIEDDDPAQELLQNLEQYCSNQISDVKILPSPLKSANQSSCSLAIRPSKGNFLIDYKNSSDLHICVTTSDGKVVEFDQNGVRCHDLSNQGDEDNAWKSCLIIKMLDNLSPTTSQLWDSKLFEFIQNERWVQSAYDPLTNNCFDFVLEFLRSLDLDYFNSSAISCKTKFCEQFIVPKTRLLARYISLYRKIEAEKVVILELTG